MARSDDHTNTIPWYFLDTHKLMLVTNPMAAGAHYIKYGLLCDAVTITKLHNRKCMPTKIIVYSFLLIIPIATNSRLRERLKP